MVCHQVGGKFALAWRQAEMASQPRCQFSHTGRIGHQRDGDVQAVRQWPQQQAGFKVVALLPQKAGVLAGIQQCLVQQTAGAWVSQHQQAVPELKALTRTGQFARTGIGLTQSPASVEHPGGRQVFKQTSLQRLAGRQGGGVQVQRQCRAAPTLDVQRFVVNQMIVATHVAKIGAAADAPGQRGQFIGSDSRALGQLVQPPRALKTVATGLQQLRPIGGNAPRGVQTRG